MRYMKAFFGALSLMFLLSALPVAADHERPRGFGFRPDLQWQQDRRGPPAKGDQWRDPRRERQPERGQRGQGRLTDEERKDLHRDLDRANRELYRRRSERR
jgi:hypothetical protein